MRVLITYGTKYGSTQQIAKWMAERVPGDAQVDIKKVNEVDRVDEYSHIIIGSPLYDDDLLPEVKEFIQDHGTDFKKKAVGVFGVALGHYGEGLYGNPAGGHAYFERFFDYLPIKPIYSKLLCGELNPQLLDEEDRRLLEEYWEIKGKPEIPHEQKMSKAEAWDYVSKYFQFAKIKANLDDKMQR